MLRSQGDVKSYYDIFVNWYIWFFNCYLAWQITTAATLLKFLVWSEICRTDSNMSTSKMDRKYMCSSWWIAAAKRQIGNTQSLSREDSNYVIWVFKNTHALLLERGQEDPSWPQALFSFCGAHCKHTQKQCKLLISLKSLPTLLPSNLIVTAIAQFTVKLDTLNRWCFFL